MSSPEPKRRASDQREPDEKHAQNFRYPKLHSLLKEKHRQLSDPQHSIPPIYLPSSPLLANDVLPANPKFDVILLSPPPEVTFEQLQQLDLARWGATPGFVWLWVGSGQRGDGVGLERGRELLQGWGFRCVI